MTVERQGEFVERFDDHTHGADFCGSSPASVESIHEQKAAEFLTAMGARDRQPAQQCGWKTRIAGELFRDGVGEFAELDAIARERVVADDGAALVQHNEWRGGFSSSVLAGLLMQIAV